MTATQTRPQAQQADARIWRGPCGSWHYAQRACSACAALAHRKACS